MNTQAQVADRRIQSMNEADFHELLSSAEVVEKFDQGDLEQYLITNAGKLELITKTVGGAYCSVLMQAS